MVIPPQFHSVCRVFRRIYYSRPPGIFHQAQPKFRRARLKIHQARPKLYFPQRIRFFFAGSL